MTVLRTPAEIFGGTGEREQPMTQMTPPFEALDDLVLRLKGLVLVRELRQDGRADGEELELYDAEIRRVRDQLADLVRSGAGMAA
jgi:hypothetical protein